MIIEQFLQQVAFDGNHDSADERIGREDDFHGQVWRGELNSRQESDVPFAGLGIVKCKSECIRGFPTTASSEDQFFFELIMMKHHAQVRAEVEAFHIACAHGWRQGDVSFGFDGATGCFNECPHGTCAFVGVELEDHV